jgi:excinuclease ABC subunit B
LLDHVAIYPASHYVTPKDKLEEALKDIEQEMEERVKYFEGEGKLIEAQRIRQRTEYDMEMLREIGFCNGIENYSRVLSGRAPGSPPATLLDFFGDDFLLIIDESHVTLPQVRGMYGGDRSRKEMLVNYGFRLPSAYDNRPLNFGEFTDRLDYVLYVSATPAAYELERSSQVAEQIIRPTGLLDPEISVRPVDGQMDDLLQEIHKCVDAQSKVLVTTLTKRMAEDLSEFLEGMGVKVKYLHHDVKTVERMEIVRDLRLGLFDVLVGINLLREGLDIPEVALVAILDADKEGFLRSETSLIQTIGRAARNANGRVIMYADQVTPSMERAIRETERRRSIQAQYNNENGIVPATIQKAVHEVLEIGAMPTTAERRKIKLSQNEKQAMIKDLEKQMKEAARLLEFEYAAMLRDKIEALKGE